MFVRVDVASVQSFIFESSRLAQMRGASALLRSFDEVVRELASAHEAVLEIGRGGQYRLECADGSLDSLINALRTSFTSHTGLESDRLEISVASKRANLYGPFCVDAPNPVVRQAALPALVERCGVCRNRPAEEFHTKRNQTTPICGVCTRRSQAGFTHGDEMNDLWDSIRLADNPSFDLTSYTETSLPANYIAVIAADGDAIGDAMTVAAGQGLEAEVKLSDELQDGTLGAVRIASYEIDLLPLWVGGDDVVLAARPQDAMLATHRLICEFAAATGRTMSAGMVIAHHKLPFVDLVALAEELLDSAKRRRRTDTPLAVPSNAAGLLDFEIVRGSMTDRLDRLRCDRPVSPILVVSERHKQLRGDEADSDAGEVLFEPSLIDLVDTANELIEADVPRRDTRNLAALDGNFDVLGIDAELEFALSAAQSSGHLTRITDLVEMTRT